MARGRLCRELLRVILIKRFQAAEEKGAGPWPGLVTCYFGVGFAK